MMRRLALGRGGLNVLAAAAIYVLNVADLDILEAPFVEQLHVHWLARHGCPLL
jgi:hypothetical protein